jgi:hypothetical protein
MSVEPSEIIRRDKTITQRPGMIGMIDGFEAAWDANDLDGVMAFFADNAALTVRPPLPGERGLYSGKEQIAGFMRGQVAGAQVRGIEHEMVGGDRVSWAAEITNEKLQQLGLAPARVSCEAKIMQGRIQEMVLSFREDVRRKLEASGTPGATETPPPM